MTDQYKIPTMSGKKPTPAQTNELLQQLQERFEKNRNRHKGLDWSDVLVKLRGNSQAIRSLHLMEVTGGAPDVVSTGSSSKEVAFFDCSPESPKGRRSLCYDREALEGRKEHKPAGSAVDMAGEMGVELLTEAQYRLLQQAGKFDQKTSSWIKTPSRIRELGGAIFCDRRYDTVFLYHNGAESYYAARGFRAMLRV